MSTSFAVCYQPLNKVLLKVEKKINNFHATLFVFLHG